MAVVVSFPPVARADTYKTKTFTDTKRSEIVRQANMAAARAVADIIRTTHGFREIVKSILEAQAFKNQCDIDILCDIYPGFLE
ncbi:hypothetical protein FCM35_KLT10442 [Carex littledalei]|uniref:Uncharacterized protein n=1 Tax=Carex littledalei TaxID=544730 RepID=A0A833QUI1_9POAL|nr:hypothetical protein FCM35_KLT10442 [Carex littledalei]